MSKQNIVVTGAAGFIGSHACEALLARGWRVVGVDNFDLFYARSEKERNLAEIRAAGGDFELEEVDICDAAAVARLVGAVRPEAVIHLAAAAGVRPSLERPAHYARVNIEGTINLLGPSVRHGVKKFLFASSSSVYGNASRVPFSEDDPVSEPISPYAATKRAGELLCHTWWHLYKLPIFCLRFFTVYGPRQRPDLAIHKFTKLIRNDQPIPVFGDGGSSRDYTYIDDIVSGVLAALERCDRYRIYNLGGSDPVTLGRLIAGIEQALGKKARIERRPAQPGDVERTFANVSRSAAELGYRPRVPLAEGLRRFVQWYRAVQPADSSPSA